MTKLEIMKAVRHGDYKFNREYIINDYDVKNANTLNFDTAIITATVKYVNWQVGVIQNYGKVYGDYECESIIKQCGEQCNNLIRFINDWKSTDQNKQ